MTEEILWEKTKEDKILYLAEQIPKLPSKAIKAVSFMIDNFDLIEEISKAIPMTETEIQNRIAKAKEKKIMFLWLFSVPPRY